jgi:hypothetical protein
MPRRFACAGKGVEMYGVQVDVPALMSVGVTQLADGLV